MQRTPRNKMIQTSDEETKNVSEKKLGAQVKSWYFPLTKRTIVAETLEEATIINNQEVK